MPKFRRVWIDTNKRDGKPGPWRRAWRRVTPGPPKYGANGTVGPARRFTWEEVRCSDGTQAPAALRPRVAQQARLLNELRRVIAKHYGVSFGDVSIAVNSWYRTPSYNSSIGGAKFSEHVQGRATDIRVSVKGERVKPERVAEFATSVRPFRQGGIGWYDRRNGDFTHVDHRPDGPARWVNG